MLLAKNRVGFKVLAVVVALALVMPMVMMPVGAAQASHTGYEVSCPITIGLILGIIAKAAKGAAACAGVAAKACATAVKATAAACAKACTKAAKACARACTKAAKTTADTYKRHKDIVDKIVIETAKSAAKEDAKRDAKREIKRGIEWERGGGSADPHLKAH